MANHYDPNFNGVPIGNIVNGCQAFSDGTKVIIKRVPDVTGYTSQELSILRGNGNSGAHALEKHGHDVSDEALLLRAITGIAPNGEGNLGAGVNATKFLDASSVQLALSELGPNLPKYNAKIANLTPDEIARGGFAIEHTFSVPMGYGYRKGTLALETDIKEVLAAYRLDNTTGQYFLVTMYPLIR